MPCLLLIHPQVRYSGLHSSYEKSIPPLINLETRDGKGNMACTPKHLSGKAVSSSRIPAFQILQAYTILNCY